VHRVVSIPIQSGTRNSVLHILDHNGLLFLPTEIVCCELFAATMEAKAVLSSGFHLEEKGQHDKMFHTRVNVLNRACALTIDH
jgi:hypothetical protein